MPKGKKKGKKQSFPIGHPSYQQSSAGPSRPREPSDDEDEQPAAAASTSQQSQKKEKATVAQRPARPTTEAASSSIPSPSEVVGTSQQTSKKETLVTEEGSKGADVVESLASEFEEKAEIERDYSNRMVITSGLPAKQKPGKLGRPVKLVCNLFPINLLPDGNVYHYDVRIIDVKRERKSELSMQTPDKDVQKYRCLTTKVNRRVIDHMLNTKAEFQRSYAVYDGESNMYSPSPLKLKFPYKTEVIIDDESRVPKKGAATATAESPEQFKDVFRVLIKPVEKKNAFGQKSKNCAINLAVLQALFKGKIQNVDEIQEAIMALETIFRHSAALRYIPIGRNFFHLSIGNMCPLSGGIEIWFGYHQSLRLGEWKVLVNLNTSATTFFSKQPLIDYVAKSLGKTSEGLSTVPRLDNYQIKTLQGDLRNLKVETYHIKNLIKVTKCIIDVATKSSREITFEQVKDNTKKTVSIEQYFKETYGIKLKYPHLPCVQVKPKTKKNYLPMEVCFIPEGQHCRKELTDNDQREMIKYTAENPESRFRKIDNIRNKFANYDQDEYLRSFGIGVDRHPVNLTGRTIEAPSLNYANKKMRPSFGSWNIRDMIFKQGADIPSWVLLSLAHRYCRQDDLSRFAQQLQRIGNASGLNMPRPSGIQIIDGGNVKSLRDSLNQISRQAKLVVVVIPFKDKTMYRNVKQIAEVELGLQTQCIDHKNVQKCNGSLLGNLCLKINAKMGGINHTLTEGEIPKIMAKPVIIIGADVSHAGVTDKSGVSVAAVSGSLDMILSRFAVSCRLQKNKNAKKKSLENIEELQVMVKSILLTFYRHTRQKPEKIIYYRDGVSDGHFREVLEKELSAIRGACTELGRDYKPAITFVVVQKRHHVRFRPADPRDGARPEGNIAPGTVVDTEIVHPTHRDFYLCSHLGLKGTSRPAHYTILADDSDFTPDEFQRLTYYSCNISFRCSKSISIPVPVAYADLAAYRTRLRLGTLSEIEKEKQMASTGIIEEALAAVQLPQIIEHSMYYV